MIQEKFKELKEKMELWSVFSKNDEIASALLELENEIQKYREIQIYKEDFSEVSWSYVTKQNQLKFVNVLINVE